MAENSDRQEVRMRNAEFQKGRGHILAALELGPRTDDTREAKRHRLIHNALDEIEAALNANLDGRLSEKSSRV